MFSYMNERRNNAKINVALDGVAWRQPVGAISADGSRVAFWSWAGNLVAGDTENCQESPTNYSCGDVFLYDVESGQLQRIPAGEGYGSGMGYYDISLSEDGDLIQFGCSIFNRNTEHLVCGEGSAAAKFQPMDCLWRG
jgi:hypothetical protein